MVQDSNQTRKISPSDISLPPGFKIDVFAEGLTTPINIIFAENGDMMAADSGVTSGSGKVLQRINGRFEVIADGFSPPLTGITQYKGNLYVAHRGTVTVLKPNGKKADILTGLPSWGDHHNNRVVFGKDGKMYFGQGTATNSAVVGEDNAGWVKKYPSFHDYPAKSVTITGENFASKNFLVSKPETAYTGAFSPFDAQAYPHETVKGTTRASGSILRANPDGTGLELVAWGLRNPFRMKFDKKNRLVSTNHGMDVRGSRPVANSPDELHIIEPGMWYGWPDYTGGRPVIEQAFKPAGKPQPEFLLESHPNNPPKPFVSFAPHSAIMGFDFNPHSQFGAEGDIVIAEFGAGEPDGKESPYNVGHRVTWIDMKTRRLYTFAINQSGYAASYTSGGGFERPIDVLFGKNKELFIADFGIAPKSEPFQFIPETGVIWRITLA